MSAVYKDADAESRIDAKAAIANIAADLSDVVPGATA